WVVGQFVFALYQLVFRFQSPACTENHLLSPFLDMRAGRYQPTTENPGDTEQKQTDPLPVLGVIFLLFYYIIRLACFFLNLKKTLRNGGWMLEEFVSGSKKIAVVGMGYVGLPLCISLGRAFRGVIGFDISDVRIGELGSGHDRTEEVSAEDILSASIEF